MEERNAERAEAEADLERVSSRAESLAAEEGEAGLEVDDTGAQAAAMLGESDARSEVARTPAEQPDLLEQRTSEETVDPPE
jgi:hypothetical protein